MIYLNFFEYESISAQVLGDRNTTLFFSKIDVGLMKGKATEHFQRENSANSPPANSLWNARWLALPRVRVRFPNDS